MLPGAEAGALTETTKSAWGMILVVSLAVLLFVPGSIGDARWAVLLIVPLNVVLTMALAVMVAVPPGYRFKPTLMAPLCTPAIEQLEFVEALQLQLTDWNAFGKESVRVAPETALGPLLVATMVYTSVSPGAAVVRPSVLVRLKEI